jgi:hypothetical protein
MLNFFNKIERWTWKIFAAKVQNEFDMCPNRRKLGRTKKEALKQIHV